MADCLLVKLGLTIGGKPATWGDLRRFVEMNKDYPDGRDVALELDRMGEGAQGVREAILRDPLLTPERAAHLLEQYRLLIDLV